MDGIESVTFPAYRDLESPASIWGRLETRVASDDLLANLGNASVEPGEAEASAAVGERPVSGQVCS